MDLVRWTAWPPLARAVILWSLPLHDQFCVTALVHITVVGIQMAQPLKSCEDFLPT